MDWTLLEWEVVLKYIQNQKASQPKVFLPWRGAIFVEKIKVAVGNELASVDPRLDRPEAAEDTDLLVVLQYWLDAQWYSHYSLFWEGQAYKIQVEWQCLKACF